jgi:CBS domain-containing protein
MVRCAGLGEIFGTAISVGDIGLWALIGMAAMMSGTMRSPLTAIVFALELTHNLPAMLPLAAACTAAHATTVLLLSRSILTEKVARRGHHVTREYSIDPFEIMRVADIMAKPPHSLPAETTIADAIGFFSAPHDSLRHKCYPVVDGDGRVLRMVGRADALRWLRTGWTPDQTLRDLSDQALVTGYEDESVGELADRMAAADVGRVPVLRRSDDSLVGLVARRDLLQVRASVVKHERERSVLIRLLPASRLRAGSPADH